jgi:hypothetical protein
VRGTAQAKWPFLALWPLAVASGMPDAGFSPTMRNAVRPRAVVRS